MSNVLLQADPKPDAEFVGSSVVGDDFGGAVYPRPPVFEVQAGELVGVGQIIIKAGSQHLLSGPSRELPMPAAQATTLLAPANIPALSKISRA